MDDMLNVLMDMDAAARKRADEVEAMKENNQIRLAEQKSEIIDKKLSQARLQADKFAGELAEETQKRIEKIIIKSDKLLSDMEKLVNESHEDWVNEIVDRVLKN